MTVLPFVVILLSRRFLRPLGTLILKSTCAAGTNFHTAPFVIDEFRVVGSRCGPFPAALDLLGEIDDPINITKYISGRYSIEQAEAAFNAARSRSSLKVLIEMPME